MRSPYSHPSFEILLYRVKKVSTSPHSHTSLPQSAFLVCLSSLASVFLRPHRLLISASSLSRCSLISGAQQHRLTKYCEHWNFSASFTRVHCLGFSARRRRIS